jgi:hypothetical protein
VSHLDVRKSACVDERDAPIEWSNTMNLSTLIVVVTLAFMVVLTLVLSRLARRGFITKRFWAAVDGV